MMARTQATMGFIERFFSRFSRKSKKIFIPQPDGSVGGPNTFLANLQEFLKQRGVETATEIADASVVFFPVAYPVEELDKAKARGAKIVQRLDGMYYPSKHSPAQLANNEIISNIYHNYADFVVFQSNYSKRQCELILGSRQVDSTIIVNGADARLFHPKPKREPGNSGQFEFVTTGNFRNLDMIEPVVLALDTLQTEFKFRLAVIGPVAEEFKPLLDRSYVSHIDSLSLEQLAQNLVKYDAFIYSHLNPPCPNSVIEAITCGLPAVGFASGAMMELLSFNAELLAEVSDDLIQTYEQFSPQKLAAKISLLLSDYSKYEQIAAAHASDYLFVDCGTAYLKIFNELLSQ